mgnify:FL=1
MVTISGLWVYPIKSCRGIDLTTSILTADGLAWDRHWMLIDREGRFLTQRQFPRMTLIATQLGEDSLRVSATGLSDLQVPFGHEGEIVTASVWSDQCQAIDAGEPAASWFSEVLGTDCRLVAFDKRAKRISDPEFAGDSGASTLFSDGFALLVIGEGSLGALNERLIEKGAEAVSMARFRPNLVLRGVEAFDEDYIRELRGKRGLILRFVKSCARCLITNVDPATGMRDVTGEPLTTLNQFRIDRDFGTTFGQNAIVLGGAGDRVSIGDELQVNWNF